MRIIVINDPHVTFKAPASRNDDYYIETMNKLIEVSYVAKKISASRIIITGDLFHRKNEESATIQNYLNGSILRWIYKAPCPVSGVIGNHDIRGSINDKFNRPIGSLISSGLFNIEDEIIAEEGINIFLHKRNWLFNSTADYYTINKKLAEFDILITHAPFKSKELFMFGNNIDYQDLNTEYLDAILFGHQHIDLGVKLVNGCYFVSEGSLTRGSITEAKHNRTIKASILEFSKNRPIKVYSYKLKNVLPVSKVFNKHKLEANNAMNSIKDSTNLFLKNISNLSITEAEYSWILKGIKNNKVKDLVSNYLLEAKELV